jgi:2-oxoglutarate dehydrogenase E2 component (dihydrolipoamide succinyltransferase)
MQLDIKVPEVGESIREAVLAQWYKRDGERVGKGDILFLIETDKVTLEIVAEADGILKILVPEGQTVAVGAVVGSLEPVDLPETVKASPTPVEKTTPAAGPELELSRAPLTPETIPKAAAGESMATEAQPPGKLPPSVRRLIAQQQLDAAAITGTGPGGRITRGDVVLYLEQQGGAPAHQPPELQAAEPVMAESAGQVLETQPGGSPAPVSLAEQPITRKPMSRIRQRIAERLLEAKQQTAMLTTFNEIDMSHLQGMRARLKDAFQNKYGISLGIMSVFVKAAVAALQEFPEINAFIDGKDIVYHHYYHIGVAIGAERGLVVPVLRHAERLSFAALERAIADYVQKIRENRLELSDLEGGTFTLTNGGVYGSLLSTPILNTPQSGILGMHKIEERPVVVDGQIVIRPMMYVALSYDHRIVDGREAVTFLKRVKELIENPERMMLEI